MRSGGVRKREKTHGLSYRFRPRACMNASGRLDTAVRALNLLECKSREEAIPHAAFLKQLNDSRKEMTERYVQQAVECIENTSLKEDRVLVVFLPDCHESIAGIIAGRIRERYYRPPSCSPEGRKASRAAPVPSKSTIFMKR